MLVQLHPQEPSRQGCPWTPLWAQPRPHRQRVITIVIAAISQPCAPGSPWSPGPSWQSCLLWTQPARLPLPHPHLHQDPAPGFPREWCPAPTGSSRERLVHTAPQRFRGPQARSPQPAARGSGRERGSRPSGRAMVTVIRRSVGDLDLNPQLPQPEGAPRSDSGRGQTPHAPALARPPPPSLVPHPDRTPRT